MTLHGRKSWASWFRERVERKRTDPQAWLNRHWSQAEHRRADPWDTPILQDSVSLAELRRQPRQRFLS